MRAAASSSTGPLRHGSSYGLLRDMAKNKYVKAVMKRGFDDLVDRCQRDASFQFNCANQDLGPEALNFIERLAGAISPSFDRSKEQILGEKLDYATKLVFVPSAHAGSTGTQHERPRHEQFEPNIDIKKVVRAHTARGREATNARRDQRAKERARARGSRAKPPGGVTYYNDLIGKSGWDHGCRYTWYWNERRGWFWRWD